jgi:excisionase family DNA binding protein
MPRNSSRSVAQRSAEPWASVEDVAGHLGVAKDSVYRWIEHRGLPAHKIGRLWKFKLTEVDVWVRAGGADQEDNGKERARWPIPGSTSTAC